MATYSDAPTLAAWNAMEASAADKGNARLVTGTYIGDGKYGINNSRVVHFDGEPLWFAAWKVGAYGSTYAFSVRGGITHVYVTDFSDSKALCNFTWTDTSVAFYAPSSIWGMLNESGATYRYFIITIKQEPIV